MTLKEYLQETLVLPLGYLCFFVNAHSYSTICELHNNDISISNSAILSSIPDKILNMTFDGLYIRHVTCYIQLK